MADKKHIPTLFLCVIMASCENSPLVVTTQSTLNYYIEEAYFNGQKDAVENKIIIQKTNKNCWQWTNTPQKNGTQPMFNPECN